MNSPHEAKLPRAQTGLILLFSVIGCLVFLGPALATGITSKLSLSLNQVAIIRASQIAVILVSLASALAFRRHSRLKRYWRLAFAYFIAACGLVVSDYTGDWVLHLSSQPLNTVTGFAALKLGEDAAILGTILLFTLLSRDNPESLYFVKSRLQLGLGIAYAGLLSLSVFGFAASLAQGIPPDKLHTLLPIFALIALADGLTEELLFRGLFLRRMGRLVGANWANLITAVVFAFVHLQVVQLIASSLALLIIYFLLGVLLGWVMQRTESVVAPALLHAGIILLVIADQFTAFGIAI